MPSSIYIFGPEMIFVERRINVSANLNTKLNLTMFLYINI